MKTTKKPFQLATVTNGKHKDNIVSVLACFNDGDCVCQFRDKDDGKPGELKMFKKDNLKFWRSIKSITYEGGKVTYEDGKAIVEKIDVD